MIGDGVRWLKWLVITADGEIRQLCGVILRCLAVVVVSSRGDSRL